MKKYLIILLLALSCKKEDTPSTHTVLSLKDVVDSSIGTYTCTRICRNGNAINGYVYDTTYLVSLSVSKENDTTLTINGYTLSFAGNLNEKYYHFELPASGGGQHALIDSLFQHIQFNYWNGGLGGGSGCYYTGDK